MITLLPKFSAKKTENDDDDVMSYGVSRRKRS